MTGKIAFEKLPDTYGVKVESYLEDNGQFSELFFRQAVSISNQTIAFYGVSSHHQNGIIEHYIQDVFGNGRTLFLRDERHWPDVIGKILWPFALRAAEDRRDHLKLDANGLAPINKFSPTFATINIKLCHPWGCPVFVLDKRAQSGCIPKCEPKARVGFI